MLTFVGMQLLRKTARVFRIPLAIAALLFAATAAWALEQPKTKPADQFLGPLVIGQNYKVQPQSRSDGLMRIFVVESSYGQFQFNGVDFTKMRLRELDACAALDKMSKSESFMSALGHAAIAPVQLGVGLVTNPVDTINRSVTGVANMFDRAGAGLANAGSSRDNILDSLLGVSDTQRELAVELGVDPYTDFPPLAARLKEMAQAMAGGKLPVRAGLAFVPGGVGLAVSSVYTVGDAKDTLRDKTASQVLNEVRVNLQSLGVTDDTVNRLFGNRTFTPADLLIMSRALKQSGAQGADVYVAIAAASATRDEAYYQRRRAELIAARAGEFGGVDTFFVSRGQALVMTARRTVVAAYPFDDLAWNEIAQRIFSSATADLKQGDTAGAPRVFATPGLVSPIAASELKKLGWKIQKLKPVR
jgi:hypothetical protein